MRRVRWSGSEIWLFALVLFGYGYFDNGHNWNHISRFDAIFAFVEADTADRFTFQIDHFLVSPGRGRNTGDWARNPAHDYHYYSNKAPGPMLLGVPAYAALYFTEAVFGAVPESTYWTRVNTWLLNVLLTVLPAAFAAILFQRLLRLKLGLDAAAAMLLTGVLYFCTFLFPYATQFWGHVTGASFAVISLYFLCLRSRAGEAWSGVFIGLAVLSDYGSAITLVSFAVLLLVERRGSGALRFALGGLPTLFAYGLYHQSSFGSWLGPATLFNNPRFDRPEGAFGFQPEALFGLTGSAEHGLFWFLPVLLLVFPAAVVASRSAATPLRWVAIANVAGFAAMNVLFSGWHGGASLGPRYLIPSLPFWVLLLVPLAARLRTGEPLAMVGTIVALAAAAVSGANMTLLALRSPSTARGELRPDARASSIGPLGSAYQALFAGELAPPELSPIRLGGSWLVDGRVVSAEGGFVETNLSAQPETAASASSWLQMSRAGRAIVVVGWQGTLRLTVAGVDRDLGHQDSFATREVAVSLEKGDNKLEVRHFPDARDVSSFRLIALSANGSPLLPRPTRSAPIERAGGSNLGRWLGLDLVPSTLLFGVCFTSLAWGLALCVRREARQSSWAVSL